MMKAATFVLAGLLFAFSFVLGGDITAPSSQISMPQGLPIPFPFSNGNLDSTFAGVGTVTLLPGPTGSVAQAVAVQADGKIVTVGYGLSGTFNDFAVTRLNPDGSPDTTFDGDGLALTTVGPADDEAFGVAIQSDGKIVVVGQASNGVNSDVAVVRFNPDGTLDSTFDGDGRKLIDVAGSNDIGRSVALQADGKIVVAGSSIVGTNYDITVIRLDTDGLQDTLFSSQGIVTTQVGLGSDTGYSVAIQPNGKIVVAGYYSAPTNVDSVILRYNEDGALDTTFSGDGRATFAFSADDVDEALAMALQPDGRIVIAGCIRGSGRLNDYLIARIQSDGSLDQTFGSGGSTMVQFSPSPDIALGVAVQTDGKIVAAGFANNGTNNDFGVARVNPDGTLDTAFHSDGRQLTMFGPSVDSANAVAIQADGKIVVVGRAVVNGIANFGIARYGYGTNPDANDGFISLAESVAVRFDNAFRAGFSIATIVDANSTSPLNTGWMYALSPRSIETTALFSGDITVRLTLPQDIDQMTFNALRVIQHGNTGWLDRTAAAPNRDYVTRSVYATMASTGVIAAALPVASISGRVTTPNGLGLRNAIVSITDNFGTRRTATTSSFGNYSFEGLPAGSDFVVGVASKRYRFSSRSLQISSNLTGIDFVGLE